MHIAQKIFIAVTSLLLLGCGAAAQATQAPVADTIRVSLFEGQQPSNLIVRPMASTLQVVGDGKTVASVGGNGLLLVTETGGKLRIRTIEKALGTYTEVCIVGSSDTSRFSVQALVNQQLARSYCGRLLLKASAKAIRSILTIDFDQYISGVVESEVGPKQELEMYKVQAIIARTYALVHMHKHEQSGYNLCDDVHCQAYKGLPTLPAILDACTLTHDRVVVNPHSQLITAAFHANCGGQTVNSEDAWSSSRSYLRSVQCPYCVTSKSFTWRAGLPLSRWAAYISEKGVRASVESVPKQFSPPARVVNLQLGSRVIPLKTIRADLGFRSAFFNFKQAGDSIIFTGKGYGHGVGLCQDGASEMARQGKTFEEIISFYYKDCRVVNRMDALEEPLDQTAALDINEVQTL